MSRITRIVSHTDFDGVCSALMMRAALARLPVVFAEPWSIQDGTFRALPSDAIADLPLPKGGCGLWFDHHPTGGDPGDNPRYHLDTAQPSCAGFIYRTYERTRDLKRYAPLIEEIDKIDSARYTPDDIRDPSPASRISLTIRREPQDDEYRRWLIDALERHTVEEVASSPQVVDRYQAVQREQQEYLVITNRVLRKHGDVLVIDYTGLTTVPDGSHFVLFVLHPDAQYAIRVRSADDGMVKISIGANPFTRPTRVHLGELAACYGGGGHRGAGGCFIPAADKERVVREILDALH